MVAIDRTIFVQTNRFPNSSHRVPPCTVHGCSKIINTPWPPPTHNAAGPVSAWRLLVSYSSVTTTLVPLAPIGNNNLLHSYSPSCSKSDNPSHYSYNRTVTNRLHALLKEKKPCIHSKYCIISKKKRLYHVVDYETTSVRLVGCNSTHNRTPEAAAVRF